MKEVIIYTKVTCPYCVKAKELLKNKDIPFTEIEITGNEDLRAQMIEKAHGRHTVPQIFVGDHHVGGCDDLYALEDANKLDSLLA